MYYRILLNTISTIPEKWKKWLSQQFDYIWRTTEYDLVGWGLNIGYKVVTKTGKSHTHWTSLGRLLGGSAAVSLSVCHGRPLSLLDPGVLLHLGSDPPLGVAQSQLLSVD